jgi:predicted ATPase
VVCLFWLVHVLFALGYPEQARARMRDALDYARELAHPYTLAYARSVACMFHGRFRPGTEARLEADALVAFAREQGFPLPAAIGTAVGGWALLGEGAAEEGMARLKRGLADYLATGAELWVLELLVLLAEAHGRLGEPAAGLAVLADALDRVERTGGRWLEAELHRLRGELLLALPEPEPPRVEACFRRALTVAREQGAKLWELRAATNLARLRKDEAEALLVPVLGWFTEGRGTPALEEAERLLDGPG